MGQEAFAGLHAREYDAFGVEREAITDLPNERIAGRRQIARIGKILPKVRAPRIFTGNGGDDDGSTDGDQAAQIEPVVPA